MTLVAANGCVACVPPPAPVDPRKGAVKFGAVATEVVELEVLHGNVNTLSREQIDKVLVKPGDKVYVRAAALTNPWARERCRMNGQEFVLVPLTEVVFFSC